MYKLTIHTDNGTFEINIDKLQELGTILINYDGYDYVRAQRVEEEDGKRLEKNIRKQHKDSRTLWNKKTNTNMD